MGDAGGSWFDEARFGMFVHWDHASQAGREVSWPLVGGLGNLPGAACGIDEYHETAATFAPAPGAAEEWAAAAKAAGMGYAVLTTRHHNGFSLWPSAVSEWSVGQFLPGRDLVREFVDAFRGEGLRVGFYYSLSDWHHPDYPAFTEADKPYSYIAYRRPSPEAWERYLAYVRAQLTELLTDYGAVDVLWFDGQWERTAQEWRADELRALIRSLQPDCLVNDRLPGQGDFETPEQFIPPEAPADRWEACLTMNRSWGYVPDDTAYKSARELVHTLCETAGRGGNLLLNVSPRGDGSLPPEQLDRLDAVDGWMFANGEAIRGTSAGLAPWQFYGPTTRRGYDTVYLHLLSRPYDTVTVRGIPTKRIAGVRHLATGTELAFTTRMTVIDELFNSDPSGEAVIAVPEDVVDDLATVLAVTITPA